MHGMSNAFQSVADRSCGVDTRRSAAAKSFLIRTLFCALFAVTLALGVAPTLALAAESDAGIADAGIGTGAGAGTSASASAGDLAAAQLQSTAQLTAQADDQPSLTTQDATTYALKYTFNSTTSIATVTGFTGTASGDLVIPETVASGGKTYTVGAIGDNAFEGQTGFTGTLTIPATVTKIGASAFKGCSGLQGPLSLPTGLEELGSYAFSDCLLMAGTVTIPAGVTAIPEYCFYMSGNSGNEGERGLTGITFAPDSNLASIGQSAFEGNWYIKGGIDLPDGVESIGAHAFGNTGARVYDPRTGTTEPAGAEGELHLPASLKTIGEGAFKVASFSGDLVIPASVTSMGDEAFYSAGFTGSLILPEGMKAVGNHCFYDCEFDGTVTLPSTLETIGENAFGSCEGFCGEVAIPQGVTQIGANAFYGFGSEGYGCSLVLPSNLKSIGASAFARSAFAGPLAIPDSVESIGESAFSYCLNFTSLTLPNNANFTEIPAEAFSASKYNQPGYAGALVIPDSVTSIGEEAFAYCSGFTSLTLPSNLANLGDGAFSQCSGLAGSLTLPATLQNIPNQAFYYCSGLTGLVIESGVTSIGEDAFYGCKAMSGGLTIPASVKTIADQAFMMFGEEASVKGSLVIENGVESIGDSAFSCCRGFTGKITVPDSVDVANMGADVFEYCESVEDFALPSSWTEIPEGIFCGCESLTGTLELSPSITSIGDNAFRYCKGFTGTLDIPQGVTEIGSSAFEECTGFTGTLAIPTNVTTIGSSAFGKCAGFTGELVIPANVTSLGSSAFSGCSGFSSVVMNQSCTTLPSNLFNGCTGLTGNITIPSNVTAIDSYAFYNCAGLTGDITIPSNVTAIGSYVFYNCTGLTGTLTIPESVVKRNTSTSAFAHTYFGTIVNNSQVSFNVSDVSAALNAHYEDGTGTVDAIGTGTYSRKTGDLVDLSTAATIGAVSEQSYSVYGNEPSLTVKVGDTALSKGTHYTVEFSNNTSVGSATATIKGIESAGCTGELSTNFTIVARSITPYVFLSEQSYVYDGTQKTPDVTVQDGWGTYARILDPADYDVAYADNVNAGCATATVTLKGNYSGSNTAYFYIRGDQTVTAEDKTAEIGVPMQLGATASGGGTLAYASSDESVANVFPSGVLVGKKAGTATITITAVQTDSHNEASATISVTVTKRAQVISVANTKVKVGETASLGAKASGGGALSYASSDPDVVAVDANGAMTGKKAGTATITVSAAETDANMAATKDVTVTVTATIPQTITASNKAVKVGKTVALDAKASGGGALSYASSNAAVASVNASGVVTGKSVGTAKITITAAAKGEYASATKVVTVTVAKNANTLVTKAQSKKLRLKKVKKKKQTFKAAVIKAKGQGTVTYARKSVTAKYKKYVKVAKNGKITVKKGAKKGKCTLVLTVSASGTSAYAPATKTAKVKIVIK